MDILIILFIVLMIVTVVGHLNWVAIRWIVRWLSADEVVTDEEPRKPSDPRHQRKKDLAVTEHQITRFYTDGKLSDEVFQHLMKLIQARNGIRAIPDATHKLGHELADCLWSVLVLAQTYGIDLEAVFLSTMDELAQHIATKRQSLP